MKRPVSLTLFAESLLLAVILISGLTCALFFFTHGYLPQPFMFDVNDDFMDWYNPAYWAHHPGAYDLWGSVYPPLSFVFLSILSLSKCYAYDPFLARACDPIGRWALGCLFLVNFYLVLRAFLARERKTALFRAAALCFGAPMLFTLHRGNLAIPCFTAFVLSQGALGTSQRFRWIANAITINFKPYMLVVLTASIVKRQWHSLESTVIWIGIVYIISFLTFGSGSIFHLIANEFIWIFERNSSYFESSYYSFAFKSLISFLVHSGSGNLPLRMGSFSSLNFSLILATGLGQIGALAALGTLAFSKTSTPHHRIQALALSLLISTIDPGTGESLFLIFLIFLEPWRGLTIGVAIVSAYLSLITGDFIVAPLIHAKRYAYLSGQDVMVNFGLGIGAFIRPALILIIQYALTAKVFIDLCARSITSPRMSASIVDVGAGT